MTIPRDLMSISAYLPTHRWDGVPVTFSTCRETFSDGYSLRAFVSRDGAEACVRTDIGFGTMLLDKYALCDAIAAAATVAAQKAVLAWRRSLWAGWEDALLGGEV